MNTTSVSPNISIITNQHTGVNACQDHFMVCASKTHKPLNCASAALPHPSTSPPYCLDPPELHRAVLHRSAVYLSECFALGMEPRAEPPLCHGKLLELGSKDNRSNKPPTTTTTRFYLFFQPFDLCTRL